MINERINLWQGNEYTYPASYGFRPNLRSYIHDDEEKRDCMIVVPGGAYCMVAINEAYVVAKEFYDRGMNTFVLTYTTDITTSFPVMKQPLNDLSRAVRIVRKNEDRFKIKSNRLFICGFSAGGHLCSTLVTHFNDVKDCDSKLDLVSNRPDGAILSYPVISMGTYTESFSRLTLLGPNPTEDMLDYFSTEKCVTKDTPPCFLWHTQEDGLVSVNNTELFSKALQENGIPYAKYIFPSGHHGLALANKDYFDGNFGEPYVSEQLDLAIKAVKNGTAINVSEERTKELLEQFKDSDELADNNDEEASKNIDYDAFSDVRLWPDLAMKWMERI